MKRARVTVGMVKQWKKHEKESVMDVAILERSNIWTDKNDNTIVQIVSKTKKLVHFVGNVT